MFPTLRKRKKRSDEFIDNNGKTRRVTIDQLKQFMHDELKDAQMYEKYRGITFSRMAKDERQHFKWLRQLYINNMEEKQQQELIKSRIR